ncbi:MAG: aminoacyl-histidine dipeptidase [Melioribacteraceae bacterium]|nr:aminoacyl-histidine dipeptidase [Melioribacteraceae bacterium]
MNLKVVEGLEPKLLWHRFAEISQIPRCSKHEEAIRTYLKNFALNYNLNYNEDETGNIVIELKASDGFENYPTIVLQSHVDMVCEKNKEKEHDFLKDGIELIKDGEWIKANGTTLGADNGIGVAAQLAIAEENDFLHGPIELLFTVDEETGLTGVNTLKPNFIKGKILLNLDTEEDGTFYIGCSGGIDTAGYFKVEFEELKKDYSPYRIFVNGCKGGHSGVDISEGRANAIKLLAYLLLRLENIDYQLAYIHGGSKRNAIPREAEAVIYINEKDEAQIRELLNELAIETSLEYKKTDPEIKFTLEKLDPKSTSFKNAFEKKFSKKIINTLNALPHGVISMSHSISGLVETSTNLANVNYDSYELIIGTSQRSSIENAKRNISKTVQSIFELANAKVKTSDGYPGWQPNIDSELLKKAKNIYQKTFGVEPSIKAVHAGLECGILIDKYPGIDVISFGPTILGAHSPTERVNINSVDKFYNFLKILIHDLIK